MILFDEILPPVLLVLILVLTTSATPFPAKFEPSTHRTHFLGHKRSLKLEAFHPRSTFQGFGVDGAEPHPIHRRYTTHGTLDTGGTAVSFLASKLSVSEDDVHIRTSAQGPIAHHVFLVQKINGISVANAVGNVAFTKNGKVSSFSSSFIKHSGSADIHPSVSLDDAIATAEKTLDGTYDGHPTSLEFVVQPSGFAALAYVIQIRNERTGAWYEAFVDAHKNTVLSVTNFVVKAAYYTIPFEDGDIKTSGFFEFLDPQDLVASPNGWHQEFNTSTNETDGNNVIAYTGSQIINATVASSAELNFTYVYDPTQDPTVGTNVQAAVTNAFYVVNSFHDFAYRYGFTETTFNFQTNNFDKGGEGFDRILVNVHDDVGEDGVEFAILPDGQSSTMRLFLYEDFSPKLDSALQNGILIHELQHGANNRMTGGGTARCFQTLEAAGLDEGYSDAMADAISQNGNTKDYTFGADVSTKPTGLRTYNYTTSEDLNPLRYSNLEDETDIHLIGEIWANILHNVFVTLVETYSWSSDEEDDPTKLAGNIIFFHLLYDALLLEPCNPTFAQARDAWIQADATRYKGANKCLLWKKFASKGLGVNAANYIDDTTVPSGC